MFGRAGIISSPDTTISLSIIISPDTMVSAQNAAGNARIFLFTSSELFPDAATNIHEKLWIA